MATLGAQEPLPEATLVSGKSSSERPPLRVADCGALGDGGHDDGPAINDHLYIRNITGVSPNEFRFYVKEDYVPRMKGMAVGNWASYGLNKANLPAGVVAAKDKSASTHAQIPANRVSDMHGDVTLREVRVIRIRVRGVRNLSIYGNRIERNGRPVERTAGWIQIAECVDMQLNAE